MPKKESPLSFTLSDVGLTTALDTYIRPKNPTKTLVLKKSVRESFFADKKELNNLLFREIQNPLLEEGKMTDTERERIGEHYLTFEAMTLLVEKKIRSHQLKTKGLNYNTKKIFLVKNDLEQLTAIVSRLNLNKDEDAKLIYITGIHSINIYLRNEQNQIKCFILDSEGSVNGDHDELISSIQNVFPEARIYLSSTVLQKDFYSCTTFAIKTLMYLVKHGNEVFPWLEKNSHYEEGHLRVRNHRLMPPLLKMCQSTLELNDDILDSIVSHKKKLSLRDYYALHTFSNNSKQLNASALLKKYKYLEELNDFLQTEKKLTNYTFCPTSKQTRKPKNIYLNSSEQGLYYEMLNSDKQLISATISWDKLPEKFPRKVAEIINSEERFILLSYLSNLHTLEEGLRIDSNLSTPLPRSLEQRHKRFFEPPKDSPANKINNPFDIYMSVLGLCEKNEKKPSSLGKYYLDLVVRKIPNFHKEYQETFPEDCKKEKELVFIEKICFIAGALENGAISSAKYYVKFASKLRSFFAEQDDILAYLQKFTSHKNTHPLYAICLFPLPREQDLWDKKYWNQLVLKHGSEALGYVKLAPQIDLLRKSTQAPDELDLPDLTHLMKKLRYPLGAENPELQDLCAKYLLSINHFNFTLSLLKIKQKTFDLLPDISIEGKDLGSSSLKEYKFIKLPINDLNGLFLGELTACCQSAAKEGASCAFHGMTSPMSGFYVVLNNKNEVVAQTWAWLGTESELVLDSWELRYNAHAFLFRPFISKLAELAISYGYSRVLLGTQGKTPNSIYLQTDNPAVQKNSAEYSDAEKQYLIQTTEMSDLSSRFKSFAAQINLNYEPYLFLFETNSQRELQRSLSGLIRNGLPFNDFMAIIRFAYIQGIDFLHYGYTERAELVRLCFDKYDLKMAQFFYLTNNNDTPFISSVFELTRLEQLPVEALFTIIEKGIYSELVSDKNKVFIHDYSERVKSTEPTEHLTQSLCQTLALHYAASNGDFPSFKKLYERYYNTLTWGEFLIFPGENCSSPLEVAAFSNKPRFIIDCLRYFVEKNNDNDELIKFLNSSYVLTHYEQDTDIPRREHLVLACLVRNRSPHYLEELRKLITDNAFRDLLNKEEQLTTMVKSSSRQEGKPQNPLLEASEELDVKSTRLKVKVALFQFARNLENYEVADYLLRNFYTPQEVTETIFKLPLNVVIKLLPFLHKFYTEGAWINFLHNYRAQDSTILQLTIKLCAWGNVRFLINSVGFDELHKLLMAFQLDKKIHPDKFRLLLNEILEKYKQHPQELFALISLRNYDLLKIFLVIEGEHLDELLKIISRELTDTPKLLGYIVELFSEKDVAQSEYRIRFKTLRLFVDFLFAQTLDERHKEEFFANVDFLAKLTDSPLEYFLRKIKDINHGQFYPVWFEKNKARLEKFPNYESFAMTLDRQQMPDSYEESEHQSLGYNLFY